MPHTILIVDDDRPTLAGLAGLVQSAGHTALEAASFADARCLLSHVPVDLLVVDVRLGEYNGLQLIVLARTLPSPPAAIVTSGFADRVLENEARQLGAPFLLKPIDPPRFLALIDRLTARREA